MQQQIISEYNYYTWCAFQAYLIIYVYVCERNKYKLTRARHYQIYFFLERRYPKQCIIQYCMFCFLVHPCLTLPTEVSGERNMFGSL